MDGRALRTKHRLVHVGTSNRPRWINDPDSGRAHTVDDGRRAAGGGLRSPTATTSPAGVAETARPLVVESRRQQRVENARERRSRLDEVTVRPVVATLPIRCT